MHHAPAIVQAVFAYAQQNRLEAMGVIAGLACVVLLIRQSIWNWPLGAVYSAISVYLFLQVPLYGQVLLNGYFLAMNLYGWWLWLRRPPTGEDGLVVSRASVRLLVGVLALAAVGVLVLGVLFHQFTDSRYPPLDIGIALLSTAAMWLQAQKKLENWSFWFVVNVASVVLFMATQQYFYALLYLIYVPTAIEGHVAWRRTMAPR
jgi:nicotinamide mononucleotide transporter